ncbi:DNA repair rad5 [Fusarium sporotrichioides]|uniref:DNA repair rad5 n=1 Tax=Fusarium sporotrichioides TaxID=5514 RepID=A0A395S7U6_FUSSP|nr:DNA repair rad5 [Fusarium sporotrichioides]
MIRKLAEASISLRASSAVSFMHGSGKSDPVVVLDESHDAKKPKSQLNRAISRLNYNRILMLTGTPTYNTFVDLVGQTMLLPGGGFLNHLFCDQTSFEPEDYKQQLYCRLYQSLIVTRAKEVIKVPRKMEELYINTARDRVWTLRVASKVRKAKFILRQKLQTQDPVQKTSYPLLAKATLKGSNVQDYDRRLHRYSLTVELGLKVGFKGAPPFTPPPPPGVATIDAISPDQFAGFQACWCVIEDKCISVVGMSEAEAETEAFINSFPQQDNKEDIKSPVDADSEGEDDELQVNQDTHKDPWDDDYDDAFAKEWLEIILPAASDQDILTERVEAIISLVDDILAETSQEKILIVSSSAMFLDVLNEAIRRRRHTDAEFATTPSRYDGTVPTEDRRHIAQLFSTADDVPRLLLLSAHAGGTGLNLAGASRVILCEPWWALGQEDQVVGRAYRKGQIHPVRVYKVFNQSLVIDTIKIASIKRKQAVVGAGTGRSSH